MKINRSTPFFSLKIGLRVLYYFSVSVGVLIKLPSGKFAELQLAYHFCRLLWNTWLMGRKTVDGPFAPPSSIADLVGIIPLCTRQAH